MTVWGAGDQREGERSCGIRELAKPPDEVWRKFAEDCDEAIRRTAAREPSARERAVAGGLGAAEKGAWVSGGGSRSCWSSDGVPEAA